jgi:DNA segregation ATPase FtsK/SpoIIIE-like protein
MEEFVGLTAPLYEDILNSGKHTLIAGCPGSGKSTLITSLLEVLSLKDVNEHKSVLIDVKMVELSRFENTKHCIRCATSIEDAENTLEGVLRMVMARLDDMKSRGIQLYDKSTVHLVVDEMADLMLTSKKAANLLQRICQLGRATKVQVIVATQCPLASVIPTRIKVNFPVLIGLHTATAQHSRNIIEVSGCEELPMYGEALIRWPGEDVKRVYVPKIPDEVIEQSILTDLKECTIYG